MARKSYVTGVIHGIERLANSTNGNPRFRISMVVGTAEEWVLTRYVTETDSQCGFDVNSRGYCVGDTVRATVKTGRTIDTITHLVAVPHAQS